MRTIEAQRLLRRNGFPCGKLDDLMGPKTRMAILRFQRAYAGGRTGGKLLARNGNLNAATAAALRGLPYLSPHFTTDEFGCKHCGRCYMHRAQILALERYRSRFGAFRPISGFRCVVHNRNVGGASASMHTYARKGGKGGASLATDVPARATISQVRALGLFSGIGYNRSTGLVAHVDRRHLIGNTPAIWAYGR